jgi:subtilisin family serine protease
LGVFALAAAAGCGGSNGGTTVLPPGPTPSSGPATPSATYTPRPSSAVVNSVYTLDSAPKGLSVFKDGGVTPLGSTLVTDTPQFANTPTTYAIHPSNGAADFTYTTSQTANGPHTIYYNQNADTTGTLGTIQAASVQRAQLAAVSGAAAGFSRHPLANGRNRSSVNPNLVVVRYRTAALKGTGRAVSDIEGQAGAPSGRDLGYERNGLITRTVGVPSGLSAGAFMQRMRANAEVESVQPAYRRYTLASNPVDPNDPYFTAVKQWGLYSIAAPNAWGYTTGASAIKVAIIDTGIDATNPEIAGKIAFAEKVLNGAITPGLAAAQDNDGHGTNVAGIVAAATNNATGFAGAGFNVVVQAFKVFPDPTAPNYDADPNYGATDVDIAEAIYEAVAHGANVVNLSLGGCQSDSVIGVERDAVNYALAHNVAVVAAAGNDGPGNSNASCQGGGNVLEFPAAYDGVISVGATSLNDTGSPNNPAGATEYVAKYSNAGPNLSVVAPGGDATSAEASSTSVDYLHWIANISTRTPADPGFQCQDTTICPALFVGTSQASPHVAGVVALMLSRNAALAPSQVAQILMNTADNINDARQGHGRVNAYRALAAVTGDAAPATPPATNFVAIAYTNSGGTKPTIANVTYPQGVPVPASGIFRIADVLPALGNYKIGVWNDANGNGIVDAGDWFGASGQCTSTTSCTANATGISVNKVTTGFTLP